MVSDSPRVGGVRPEDAQAGLDTAGERAGGPAAESPSAARGGRPPTRLSENATQLVLNQAELSPQYAE